MFSLEPHQEISFAFSGLTDELANVLKFFRNALRPIGQYPYLQRIGALLGLVCPRNNGSTCAIRDIWAVEVIYESEVLPTLLTSLIS